MSLYEEVKSQVEEIEKKTEPLKKERDELQEKLGPMWVRLREVSRKIRELEEPLIELSPVLQTLERQEVKRRRNETRQESPKTPPKREFHENLDEYVRGTIPQEESRQASSAPSEGRSRRRRSEVEEQTIRREDVGEIPAESTQTQPKESPKQAEQNIPEEVSSEVPESSSESEEDYDTEEVQERPRRSHRNIQKP